MRTVAAEIKLKALTADTHGSLSCMQITALSLTPVVVNYLFPGLELGCPIDGFSNWGTQVIKLSFPPSINWIRTEPLTSEPDRLAMFSVSR